LWYTSVIPTFGRLMQEDLELKANLGYIGRPHIKNKQSWKCDSSGRVPWVQTPVPTNQQRKEANFDLLGLPYAFCF
jgi:hypothetical protein